MTEDDSPLFFGVHKALHRIFFESQFDGKRRLAREKLFRVLKNQSRALRFPNKEPNAIDIDYFASQKPLRRRSSVLWRRDLWQLSKAIYAEINVLDARGKNWLIYIRFWWALAAHNWNVKLIRLCTRVCNVKFNAWAGELSIDHDQSMSWKMI